jgi:hypothetical protein
MRVGSLGDDRLSSRSYGIEGYNNLSDKAYGSAGGIPGGYQGGTGTFIDYNDWFEDGYDEYIWTMGGAGGGGYSSIAGYQASGGKGSNGLNYDGYSGGTGGNGGSGEGIDDPGGYSGAGKIVITLLNSPPSISLTQPTDNLSILELNKVVEKKI